MFSGVILQQAFSVEFIIHSFHCTNCHRVAADNTWTAVVQVRQKVRKSIELYYARTLYERLSCPASYASGVDLENKIELTFAYQCNVSAP